MTQLGKVTLGVLVAMLLAVAPIASAACDGCTTPCGDYYSCCLGCVGSGEGYSECRNVGNCAGCMGWHCDGVAEQTLELADGLPFQARFEVATVRVENRASHGSNIDIAAVDLETCSR